jgi:hypothetical protein
MVDNNPEVPEFMEGAKIYINPTLSLYFPHLSKEEFSKKQAMLGKRKTKPSWPKGKPRPNSSIAAKRQWADPEKRKNLEEGIRNARPPVYTKEIDRTAVRKMAIERNTKRQKCVKMMKKYGLDVPQFSHMSDGALNALYEDLCQWAI